MSELSDNLLLCQYLYKRPSYADLYEIDLELNLYAEVKMILELIRSLDTATCMTLFIFSCIAEKCPSFNVLKNFSLFFWFHFPGHVMALEED